MLFNVFGVIPVTREMLLAPSAAPDVDGFPDVPLGTSLYDALARMLTANADYARVTAGDECVGLVSRHRILSIDYPADPVPRHDADDARPRPGG